MHVVALSGIDGAGKSTQLNLIKVYFEHKKLQTVSLWTRGGYTTGMNLLKNIGRRIAGKRLPPSGNSVQREQIIGKAWVQKLWLTIAILDLMRIYGIQLRFWLLQGKVVICDRYLWDTWIDFKLLFPGIAVEDWFLWKMLVRITPKPSVQCLLMIPLALSEVRCRQKYEPFPDPPEKRPIRYGMYRDVVDRSGLAVVDSTQPAEKVFEEIRLLIEQASYQ